VEDIIADFITGYTGKEAPKAAVKVFVLGGEFPDNHS